MLDKIKKNYFLLISTILFLYFFFNLLDGERGLISLIKKENLLKKLELEEKQLTMIISNLESKNNLLSDNIDKDYVEILLREKFLYSKKGEKIYILKNNEKSD